MKKAERKIRAEARAKAREKYKRQDETVDAFCYAAKPALNMADWVRLYERRVSYAGEMFHVFEAILRRLVETQAPIEPLLRKAIDAVLEAHDCERAHIDYLRHLNYDRYWKQQYGYE